MVSDVEKMALAVLCTDCDSFGAFAAPLWLNEAAGAAQSKIVT